MKKSNKQRKKFYVWREDLYVRNPILIGTGKTVSAIWNNQIEEDEAVRFLNFLAG